MTSPPFSSSLLSSSSSSSSVKVSTLVKKINATIPNRKNASIILDFYKYMQQKGSSENHQVNNLKVVVDFAKFLGTNSFYDIKKREQIISFLNKKIKTPEEDPDKRWITTWNNYLNRIKLFYRWLYNNSNDIEHENWQTPEFIKIKTKKSKNW